MQTVIHHNPVRHGNELGDGRLTETYEAIQRLNCCHQIEAKKIKNM